MNPDRGGFQVAGFWLQWIIQERRAGSRKGHGGDPQESQARLRGCSGQGAGAVQGRRLYWHCSVTRLKNT